MFPSPGLTGTRSGRGAAMRGRSPPSSRHWMGSLSSLSPGRGRGSNTRNLSTTARTTPSWNDKRPPLGDPVVDGGGGGRDSGAGEGADDGESPGSLDGGRSDDASRSDSVTAEHGSFATVYSDSASCSGYDAAEAHKVDSGNSGRKGIGGGGKDPGTAESCPEGSRKSGSSEAGERQPERTGEESYGWSSSGASPIGSGLFDGEEDGEAFVSALMTEEGEEEDKGRVRVASATGLDGGPGRQHKPGAVAQQVCAVGHSEYAHAALRYRSSFRPFFLLFFSFIWLSSKEFWGLTRAERIRISLMDKD